MGQDPRSMKILPSTCLILALAASASAQQFNVDVGSTYGTPGPSFGGAAAQPGTWNAVAATQGSSPLVSLAGGATGVTLACSGAGSLEFSYDNPGTLGDDQALMDDASDPMGFSTWTFTGLAPGNYVLTTYAWAPDSSFFHSRVSVAGSSDPAQVVGGTWTGTYVQGVTHARHHVTVLGGAALVMNLSVASGSACVNGFQLAFDSPGTQICDPGSAGVIACPCANPSSTTGRGCDNSAATGGASLAASGVASLVTDTLALTTAGELQSATSVLLQGNSNLAAGLVFGQGVRCAGGTLRRLFVQSAIGGSVALPPAGGPSLSARSAALGDPISGGAHRYYLVYYRDPIVLGACPAASTFNATGTIDVLWQ